MSMKDRGTLILVSSCLTVASVAYGSLRWRQLSLQQAKSDDSELEDDSSAAEDQNTLALPSHLERELRKTQRRRQLLPRLAMKSPMYHNIVMVDPDGEVLSTVSQRKANWYIKKGLGQWTGYCRLQLNFVPNQPQSEPSPNHVYNQSIKHNQCVVCGDHQHYMRHYIVPYAYRSLLPRRFKEHLAHDVVLLCAECQVRAEKAVHARRRQLEDGLRHDPATAQAHLTDSERYKVRNAGLALLRWRDKLPSVKIDEYQAFLRQWFGLEDLTDTHYQDAANVDYRVANPLYISGPDLVRASLTSGDAMGDFVRDWRCHFVEHMQPQHLPKGWSIDSPVTCADRSLKRR